MPSSSLAVIAGAVLFGAAVAARADNPAPYPGTIELETTKTYETLVDALKSAVGRNKMGIVAQASATQGAKSIGVTIPGNMVVMVFHPRFAVRMLEASVPAGIEAPLRYYITENPDGSATLTYRTPSSVFAPYDNDALDEMATELDRVFEQIASDALGN